MPATGLPGAVAVVAVLLIAGALILRKFRSGGPPNEP
jgi:hypothetical protein